MNLASDAGSHQPRRDVWGVGRTSPALGRVGWLLARLRLLDQEAHDLVDALAEALDLARRDPGNGLPNRQLIQERLAPAMSDPGTGAGRIGLVFIELDRPAASADPRDEGAMDLRQQAVAQRIVTCTRSGDTLPLRRRRVPGPAARCRRRRRDPRRRGKPGAATGRPLHARRPGPADRRQRRGGRRRDAARTGWIRSGDGPGDPMPGPA